MKKRKPIRKLYRATPVNREIEQKERVLHIIENGVDIKDIELDLPYRNINQLKAYVFGLKTANALMRQLNETNP